MKMYDRSKQYSIQSLAIDKKKLGVKHPNYAKGLINLALIYSDTKEYEKALAAINKAQGIFLQQFNKNAPYYIETINAKGMLYQKQGKYDLALKQFIRSLNLNINNGVQIDLNSLNRLGECQLNRPILAAISLEYIGQILQKKYTATKSEKYVTQQQEALSQAVKLNTNFRQTLARQKDKIRSLEHISKLVTTSLNNTFKRDKPSSEDIKIALEHAEQNKSILLAEMLNSKGT